MDNIQKLLLSNQYRILSIIDGESRDAWLRNLKVVENGFGAELAWLINEAGLSSLSEDGCSLVKSVLGMFNYIEMAIRPETESQIKDLLEFTGFDGNNESTYMSYAHFLIRDEKKWDWTKFAKRPDLNSHAPMLPKYMAMLLLYDALPNNKQLTQENLRSLAMVAPLDESVIERY